MGLTLHYLAVVPLLLLVIEVCQNSKM